MTHPDIDPAVEVLIDEHIYVEKPRGMADTLHDAVEQASGAAMTASAGISEFRDLVRAQPLTMALLMLGLGYVTGRIVSVRPRF